MVIKLLPRERIQYAISHKQSDKLPVDFGSTEVTGIHASIVYKLRKHFGLEDRPVKIIEPYQMLGEIDDELKEAIGVDVINLEEKGTFFNFNKENWKEWRLNDGTPALVPGLFNTESNDDGSIYQYAEGDKNFPPSAKMPANGYFFDTIIRQKEIIEEKLDSKDNLEEFKIISNTELNYLNKHAEYLYNNTPYAIMGVFGCSGIGDIAYVPAPMLKDPKGIRDIEEWYISLITRKEYIKKVFSGQIEIAIENYKKVNDAIGEKIDIVQTSGNDFGMQQGLFVSKELYRELFKPFNKEVNNWIHKNTNWKSFMHTCGAVYDLIPDFVDAGFDILNPVQISAVGMNPIKLKKEFGNDIVFWGGGIDTQKTLPFGTPSQVKEEVKQLIDIFSPNGGYVFNTVHNIQANVPIENVTAMIEVIQEYRK